MRSGKLCDIEVYLLLLQNVLGERILVPGRGRMWEVYRFFRGSEECKNVMRASWQISRRYRVLSET